MSSSSARFASTVITCLALVLLHGCEQKEDRSVVQGYVEGEYSYASAPLSGRLQKLEVKRGDQVSAGDLLFELEDVTELAARDEAERRLTQARATLHDLQKGKRPSEIKSLEAQLGQAKAALEFSERETARWESAMQADATSGREVDRARSQRDQDREIVAQLESDLQTARLGSREDQIAAAEANVSAQQAVLAAAEWALSQKRQVAPEAGLVFDTVFREGEWVAAGRPVVMLLPPSHIKVRAFVPQAQLASISSGQTMRMSIDGTPGSFAGSVAFISPEAEYTPPVIYSREVRSKMVFMIEIEFDPETAAKLHPGQPVDVHLDSGR